MDSRKHIQNVRHTDTHNQT
jgi:hypothetical protein